jgi:hypothetical protein
MRGLMADLEVKGVASPNDKKRRLPFRLKRLEILAEHCR